MSAKLTAQNLSLHQRTAYKGNKTGKNSGIVSSWERGITLGFIIGDLTSVICCTKEMVGQDRKIDKYYCLRDEPWILYTVAGNLHYNSIMASVY